PFNLSDKGLMRFKPRRSPIYMRMQEHEEHRDPFNLSDKGLKEFKPSRRSRMNIKSSFKRTYDPFNLSDKGLKKFKPRRSPMHMQEHKEQSKPHLQPLQLI
ncbi:unnamed protein product, partial [Owenia fusiformis]